MPTASATKARKSAKVTVDAPQNTAVATITKTLASSVKKGVIEDLSNSSLEVIPTGMLGLDIATGIGGFPVGRIIELYGMESCGKSTVCYHLIKEAQDLGFLPIMIETEGSVDARYMRRIGVKTDPDHLIVYSPDTMESAIDFIELAAKTSHEQGQKALLMLDSVAALAPEVMMEDSAEKKFRATAASVWSQQMPKIMTTLRRTNATLIMVNQMREGMDLYSPPSTPGGKAIKFAASMRVLMRRKIDKAEKGVITGNLGQEIHFIVEKNKLASPGRQGFAYLPGGKRVDLLEDVVGRGIERGLIEKDVKFDEGEFVKKVGYFTINLDENMVAAVEKDLARAKASNAEWPGTKVAPYLTADRPLSVFRESTLLDVLEMAPNLVAALKAQILRTLALEEEAIDEDPFAVRLREAAQAFDAGADDGASAADHLAHALADAQDVPADDDDDDMAEFSAA